METIDEAAFNYVDLKLTETKDRKCLPSNFFAADVEKAFKAGALWMAKQHANEISECTEKSFNEGVKYAVDKAVDNKIERVKTFNNFTRQDDSTALFTIYIMSSDTITTTTLNITAKALTSSDEVYQERNFYDVPIKDDYLTIYEGNFFVDFNMNMGFYAHDWDTLGHYNF